MLGKIDKKVILLIFVSAIIAAGLVWLAISWQFTKIREMSDNIQKEQLDSLVREQKNKKILELKKDLGDIGKLGTDVDSMFIDKGNVIPFIENLEAMARITGNSINISLADLNKLKPKTNSKKKSIPNSEEDDNEAADAKKDTEVKSTKNSKSVNMDFSNQLGFEVKIRGDFGSLIDFLTKIENAPYLVQIYNFKSVPAPKGQISEPVPIVEGQAESQAGETKNIITIFTLGVHTHDAK